MNGLITESARKRISDEFNYLFLGVDHKTYARKLGVSERTARRLRRGDHTPQKATALRMLEETKRLRELAGKDKAELAEYLEEVQRSYAQIQNKIAIERMREEGIAETVPKWFVRAEVAFEKGKYEVTAAILEDRLAPEEIKGVTQVLIPYGQNRHGLSLVYTGRPHEAAVKYREAINRARAAGLPAAHIAWFHSNLAGALNRMWRPEDAIRECEAAIDQSIDHLPAYYGTLCASDTLRDRQKLATWIGRTIQVAKSHISRNRLTTFRSRAKDDPDLTWARNQSVWTDMLNELKSIIESKGKV